MGDSITIGLTGDVMIGRGADEVIDKKGYRYPWGNTIALFESADINIINLETTLTRSKNAAIKVFNFRAGPDKVRVLKESRISIVNIANNHILDFSEEGLSETIRVLDESGIKHAGAGRNMREASEIAIVEKNNLKVGVLGFTDNEPEWKAEQDRAGTNYINVSNPDDRERLLQDIRQSRARVDLLIVSIHWGFNQVEEPPGEFVDLAREMADAGADLIHGHSAHNFQGIGLFNNRPVLFSAGDFVDDYIVDPYFRNDLSFFFMARADRDGIIELRLIPVKIAHCQVNLAMGKDYEECIKRIQRLSGKMGTVITNEGKVVVKTRVLD